MLDLSQKRTSGPVIRLHPNDNVVVARVDVDAGASVPGENVTARGKVPAGYKVATQYLKKGDPILKYNTVIGFAGEDIVPGTMVHSHNIDFREVDRDYAYCRDYKPVYMVP